MMHFQLQITNAKTKLSLRLTGVKTRNQFLVSRAASYLRGIAPLVNSEWETHRQGRHDEAQWEGEQDDWVRHGVGHQGGEGDPKDLITVNTQWPGRRLPGCAAPWPASSCSTPSLTVRPTQTPFRPRVTSKQWQCHTVCTKVFVRWKGVLSAVIGYDWVSWQWGSEQWGVIQLHLGGANFPVPVRFSVPVLESRPFLGSFLGS